MQDKIDSALIHIDNTLKARSVPFILWSGGKDSMALLHLVTKKYGRKMPVVFFREPWQPHKYAFQNRIIEDWGLEAYTFHPRNSALQQTDDEFEVQNFYWLNETLYTCPSGIVPPEEGKPWVCSLDMLERPKQANMWAKWDVGFVGHKSCDSDPIYGGDAGTRIDCMINPGGIMASYPMRDWSHDDVFQYCEDNDVPIQIDRYEKVGGTWNERADKTSNCDYVHACTACVDSRDSADKFVHCPKLNMRVMNVSANIPWADSTIPKHMED